MTHRLTSTLRIDRPLREVFGFFADASNLSLITPPELGFTILTKPPIEMREGALIDYRIRVHGLPMRWRTEITRWDPPFEFVDTQLAGPYAEWVHRHTFTDVRGGTLVEDEVRYRLPFGPLGALAHPLVRRDLDRIFAFRANTIQDLLPAIAAPRRTASSR